MLLASLRDLQWRRRRYLIAAIGTALVFVTTLVLTGLSHGFDASKSSSAAELSSATSPSGSCSGVP